MMIPGTLFTPRPSRRKGESYPLRIKAGLKKWWQNFNELPAEEKPMQPLSSKEEQEFLEKAFAIYKQGHTI